MPPPDDARPPFPVRPRHDRAVGPDVPFRLHDLARLPNAVRVAPGTLFYCGVVDAGLTARVDDGPPVPLRPGTSVLAPPGHRLCFDVAEGPAGGSLPGVALTMDREAVSRVVARVASPSDASATTGRLAPVWTSHPAAVEQHLRALAALPPAAPHRDTLVELGAAQLVVHLLSTTAGALLRRYRGAGPSPGLDDALRYVHSHLHRSLSVDELAEQACMSRSTFYRHFRAAFGVTPLQYVTQCRMERACALLRDPERTVTAVSLDLGFRSVSHFITTFKQHVGTTPKAYQRRSGRARRLADGPRPLSTAS